MPKIPVTQRSNFRLITNTRPSCHSCRLRSASDNSYGRPAHPDKPLLDFPTALSGLTCLQRGLCPVSSRRDSRLESHSLYYEVHGSPATAAAISPHAGDDEVKGHISPRKIKNKMVFISGWSATCLYWGPQVRWFGGGVPRVVGDEEEEYTALVFDNRGVGNSGYPRGPYT